MAAPKVYLSPAMHMANPCVYPRPDGKQCYEALENNEYIDILEPILNRCGIATKRGYRRTPMNSDNGDAIMKQNVRESDAWGADVHYVSHTNAISNGAEQTRVSGCNPMYYTYSSKGKKLGEIMVKYRKQVYPGKVTLVPNAKWYELRVPNAVSYYEEHAFHDNPNDIGWWHEHMTEVAESAGPVRVVRHPVCGAGEARGAGDTGTADRDRNVHREGDTERGREKRHVGDREVR